VATLGNKVLDYGTTFCSIWNTYVEPNMAPVMIVVWALVGIFIVMSA
jgi:hypothetical protein